jgi:hypothetical protein
VKLFNVLNFYFIFLGLIYCIFSNFQLHLYNILYNLIFRNKNKLKLKKIKFGFNPDFGIQIRIKSGFWISNFDFNYGLNPDFKSGLNPDQVYL